MLQMEEQTGQRSNYLKIIQNLRAERKFSNVFFFQVFEMITNCAVL